MIQKLQAKTFKKTCRKTSENHRKSMQKPTQNSDDTENRWKTLLGTFSEATFFATSRFLVDFWVPAGSQNGLRDTPGTLQILRQSWWRLKNRPDRLPGGSREAFGRPPGTPRVPRGTILGRFFNDFWSRLWHAKLQWLSIFCTCIFFMDPSLRRVTLIRATEELLSRTNQISRRIHSFWVWLPGGAHFAETRHKSFFGA